MMRRWWIMLLVVLAPVAQAATVHAFLDRSHVSLGDTVTLNVTSTGSLGNPDLSPLQRDFQVLGTSRSRSVQIVNGKTTSTSQLGVALKPRHAGTLTIPALDIGGAQTTPLTVDVTAAPSGGQGKVGDAAFMQASVLSSSPWVGQQTVYTVRLYYQPGVQGSLADPHADGARLIPIGHAHTSMTQRNGYAYKVLERRWALIPQRAGAITVQGPAFQGQGTGAGNLQSLLNNPNSLFNNPNALLNAPFPGSGAAVRAVAPSVHIQARAAPAGAGKPWLPARNVELKLTGLPAGGKVRAGVPLTVTLQIDAEGKSADALPEPELPAIANARVYPDQTRDTTDTSGEWLHGTRTRSFAIIPDGKGKLTIPAITLDWWNVVRGHAEQATLPAHTLQVAAAVAGQGSVAAPPAAAASVTSTSHDIAGAATGAGTPANAAGFRWRDIAIASFALWLLVLLGALAWWAYRRGTRHRHGNVPPPGPPRTIDGGEAETTRATPPEDAETGDAPAAKSGALRQRALDAARSGDAAACEHALLAWARASRPALTNAGALREALADAGQRDALDALQRARWRGGDPATACQAVARSFAQGFIWCDDDKPTPVQDTDLPPLYPSP